MTDDLICGRCGRPVNKTYSGGSPSGGMRRDDYTHHRSETCIRALGDAVSELQRAVGAQEERDESA